MAGVLLILIVSTVPVRRTILSNDRARALAAEIEATGGDVHLPTPLFDAIRTCDWSAIRTSKTIVMLDGSGLNDRWLRDHAYLNALPITHLTVYDISSANVSALLDSHAITAFSAPAYRLADSLVPAITRQSHISELNLSASTLSDSALAQLPLERLERLDISETPVTANGLQELCRCVRLTDIALDGNQLNDNVVHTLRSILSLQRIELIGPTVNDEHTVLIQQLSGVKSLLLYETSVTQARLAELKTSMPACTITTE